MGHRLELPEGPPEGPPGGGVGHGRVQGGLGHPDRERAHAGPEPVQGGHGQGEPVVEVAQDLAGPGSDPARTVGEQLPWETLLELDLLRKEVEAYRAGGK